MKTLLHISFALASLHLAHAQISIAPDQTYSQDFDSLANTGTAGVTWSNNTTLPGWYAYRLSTGDFTSYNPSTGGSDGISSFGLNTQTDRAFGTGLDLTAGNLIYFGARFVNTSAATISSVLVTYDGEQWFRNSNIGAQSDSLDFDYQVFNSGGGTISSTNGWVSVPALTFTSPVNVNGSAISLNGNLPANRTAGITSFFTGIAIDPGQELWIRWTATNLPLFSDHALAIDNLTVSFGSIPEPASYAAALGLVVAAKCMLTRRRKTGLSSPDHPVL